MTPATRWAYEHAPANAQQLAARAFAAGARAFAEMMPNAARRKICVDALTSPYLPRMTTVMEFLEEFLSTEEQHD